jgi:hypothetical protein
LELDLKRELERLAAIHGSYENDEISDAIAKHLRAHDPETCENRKCVARREKKTR